MKPRHPHSVVSGGPLAASFSMKPSLRQALLSATLVLAPIAGAQSTGTWNTSGTTGLSWNTAGSWTGLSGGVVPNAVGATPNFTFNLTGAKTITLDGDKTMGVLTIGDPTSTYYAYTLNSGAPTTSRLIFDQTGVADATITVQPAGSTAANVINAGILLNDNLVLNTLLTSTSPVAMTLGGVIDDGAGSFSLTKQGPSIAAINGANTYGGGTIIKAGRLNAGNAASFGTGTVTIEATGAGAPGGQANLTVSVAPYANNFAIAGTGFTEAGTTGNIGAIRYQGATTTGTITVLSDARLGAYSGAVGTINGPLVGTAGVALELNSTVTTSHNGTFNLNGSAAGYLGPITLSQGRLNLGATSTPGGSLTVKDGASLAGETTVAGALTLGNPGSTTTGATLYVDPVTSECLHTNGNLTLNGKTTVSLAGAITGSSVPILTYSGTLTGTAANLDLVGGIGTYRPGSGFDLSVPNQVNLTLVTGEVTWTGAANSNWNTTEANWSNGTPTTFFNLDAVTFDDSASPKAIYTTNLANAAQNDLVFTAVASGAAGELIAVEYVDPLTVSSPLSVGVAGTIITVSLATDASGVITSTATEVKDALQASGPASALVTVTLAAANDGTGVVSTLAAAPLVLANPTVNLATGVTVAPGDMTFSHSAIDYTVSGSGIIGGGGTLTKNGTGTLTLGTSNTFTGEITVNAGVVKLGNAGALGGSGTKVVTVNNGGQLDFAGISPGATRGYTYRIAGTGGGLGVLHNSSATGPASNAGVLNLELLADATVGGSQSTGRFDLGLTNGISGVITGNSHKLTKVGLNQMNMRGDASGSPIQFEVLEGSLIAENHNGGFGGATGAVTVAAGATVGAYGALTLATPVTLNDNASLISLNGTGIWTGAITLAGNAKVVIPSTATAGSGVTLQGNIGQSAPACALELSNATTTDSTVTLSGASTFSGGTTVKGLIAIATTNGAFGTGEITVASNGTVARTSRVQLGTNVELPASNSFLLDSDAATGVSAITSYAGDNTTPSTAIVNGPVEILKKVGGGGHFASNKGSASVLRILGAVTSPNAVSVVIRQGTVELGGGGDYAAIEVVDGTLKLAANNGVATNAKLTVGTSGTSGDTGTFDLNGFSQSLAGLLAGARPATVTNTGTNPSTLTLNTADASTYGGGFADGSGVLNLVKSGVGTLTLSAASGSFNGGLSVTEGTLNLTGSLGGTGATALFSPGTTLSGEGTFGGQLTLNGANLNVNGTTALGVFASGNLNVSGGVTVNLQSLPTTPGPIEVIAFGGSLTGGAGNFSLVGGSNYRSPVFSVVGSSVNLTLGAPVNLTWTGTGGSTWDINTTSNWNNPSLTPSTFLYADNVAFGNTGGGTIAVPATVNASNLVINSNDNWLFQGAGTIASSAVTKDGTGSATFECPVEFANLTLTTGTLRLSPPTGVTASVPGTITGAGTLAKGGDGILSIPNANAGFTGTMAISKGELAPGNNNAFGAAKLVFGDATTQPADVCTLTLKTGVALTTTQLEVAATCADARIASTGGTIANTAITMKSAGSLKVGNPADANVITGTSSILVSKGTLTCTSKNPLSSTTTVTLGDASTGSDNIAIEMPTSTSGDTISGFPIVVAANSDPTSKTSLRLGSSGWCIHTGTITLNRDLWITKPSGQTGGESLSGKISGTGNLRVDLGAGITVRLRYYSGTTLGSDYTGNIYIHSGRVQFWGGVDTSASSYNVIPDATKVIMSAGTTLSASSSEVIGALEGGASEGALGVAIVNTATSSTSIPTLTVGGNNLSGVFSGNIRDESSGKLFKLTKTGTGTQTLNGPCTHTGATTISQGRLLVNNTYASAITVAAGATLGGNMTSTAAITATAAAAKIAPGNSTGTMTAASVALNTGGVLDLEIDDSSTPKNDKLVATGTLNVTGATLNLTLAGTAAQPVYVLASYGTLTGTFGTVNKPTGLAAYDLVYNYNDGVSSNNIALVLNDPYVGWLAGYGALTGANRAPGVDFDGDGLDNGIEFVIGSNPTAFTGPGTAGFPAATVTGGNLVFTFKRSTASKAYAVTVETSTNLATWPPAGAYPVPTADTAGPPVTVAGESVTVTVPMGTDARKFARVKAEIPFTP